jgi:osmotically-inducible protein OsmY
MRWKRWLWLAVAACAGGCAPEDRERLTRIGSKLSARFDHATGGARGRLAGGWQAFRGSLSDSTLDSRVATRLRWDKWLAGSDVTVRSAGPGVVRLEGAVPDAAHRQRAVDLARSTLGVEKVDDALTPSGP